MGISTQVETRPYPDSLRTQQSSEATLNLTLDYTKHPLAFIPVCVAELESWDPDQHESFSSVPLTVWRLLIASKLGHILALPVPSRHMCQHCALEGFRIPLTKHNKMKQITHHWSPQPCRALCLFPYCWKALLPLQVHLNRGIHILAGECTYAWNPETTPHHMCRFKWKPNGEGFWRQSVTDWSVASSS